MEQAVKEAIQAYQQTSDAEQELRDNIRITTKEIERSTKGILGILQGIHQNVSAEHTNKVVEEAKAVINNEIKQLLQDLAGKVPMGDFYRFNDMWRYNMTKLSYSCGLMWFLETDELPLRQQVADMLGVSLNSKNSSFFLDTEDYLHGLLQVASEISRFCTNCVAQGDVGRPEKIFRVLSTLQVGFGELNLKNDSLRRMFDGLKYDVKRVEQVIYDITIRGMKATAGTEPAKSSAEGVD